MTNRNKYQRRNAKIPTSIRKLNPGVEKLTRDADLEVHKNSAKIALALANAAMEGNASSARLLIDLADGAEWMQNEEAVQHVLRIVKSWEKEEQLDEPEEVPAGLLESSSTGEPARTYVN